MEQRTEKAVPDVRRKPYTTIGIRRVPCAKCGKPSVHQWQVCAMGNQWFGVCQDCDIELNRLAVEFMRIQDGKAVMARYARKAAGR